MQLKTCTNPDRVMKHRHKILHSMEIAFSHVLWFEKKRETDSERQMETHGARKKGGGGEEKRQRCRERGSSSQMELSKERRKLWPGVSGFAFSLSPRSRFCSWVCRGSARQVPGPKSVLTWTRRKPGDLHPPIWALGFFSP